MSDADPTEHEFVGWSGAWTGGDKPVPGMVREVIEEPEGRTRIVMELDGRSELLNTDKSRVELL